MSFIDYKKGRAYSYALPFRLHSRICVQEKYNAKNFLWSRHKVSDLLPPAATDMPEFCLPTRQYGSFLWQAVVV